MDPVSSSPITPRPLSENEKVDSNQSAAVKILTQDTKSETTVSQLNVSEKEIVDDFHAIEEAIKEIEEIENEEKAAERNKKKITSIIKEVIAESVIKTGVDITRSTIGFYVTLSKRLQLENWELSSDFAKKAAPITDGIKVGAETLGVVSGLVSLIMSSRILFSAIDYIQEVRKTGKIGDKKLSELTDLQRATLDAIEKKINFELDELDKKAVQLGLKSAKTTFEFAKYIFSFLEKIPSQTLTSVIGTLGPILGQTIKGLDVIIAGMMFYAAHKKLESHSEWTEEFNQWVEQQTVKIESPLDQKNLEKLKELGIAREKRIEEQMVSLTNRLEKKEISRETIIEKIQVIKKDGLKRFLENPNTKNMLFADFKKHVETILGTSITSEKAQDLLDSLIETDVVVDEAISALDEDALLKLYIDYHAILDPTIKNSMVQMVQKKQEIESKFLKMQKVQTGAYFTFATIIFTAVLIILIIGLASNPIGAAALIILILGISATVMALGLTGAGYIQNLKERPGVSIEYLKGQFVRLLYYQARSKLSAVREKIARYVQTKILKKKVENIPEVAQLTHGPTKETLRSKVWSDKADELTEKLQQIRWKDFAKRAELKVGSKEDDFDTLETFNQLLTTCDLTLLSPSTREFLEKQLGINIHILQDKIKSNKDAVRDIVRDFFNMNADASVRFILEQKYLNR